MLQEGMSFSGNTNNPASFTLTLGGRYLATVVGTGFGTVELQVLGADGTTWESLKDHRYNGTAFAEVVIGSFANNGAFVLDLSPGTYRWNITTATAVSASIARCPLC